jgi:hypothetical protein
MNVAMKRSGIILLTFIFLSRKVLEELSIRADLALSQKKAIQEITDGVNEDFYRNYHALSAQVVCLSSFITIQFVVKKSPLNVFIFILNFE